MNFLICANKFSTKHRLALSPELRDPIKYDPKISSEIHRFPTCKEEMRSQRSATLILNEQTHMDMHFEHKSVV